MDHETNDLLREIRDLIRKQHSLYVSTLDEQLRLQRESTELLEKLDRTTLWIFRLLYLIPLLLFILWLLAALQ